MLTNNLIPCVHVASVRASCVFYAHLGFAVEKQMAGPDGVPFWASLRAGEGRVMFARASGPIDAAQQAVLLYLYSDNVKALHSHLLHAGVHDAGDFCDHCDPSRTPHAPPATSVLFDIAHPHHMPAGELRVHDPDGYVLLIGQLK